MTNRMAGVIASGVVCGVVLLGAAGVGWGQGAKAVDFKVPVMTTGDVYARYLVRFEEVRQSLAIIRQLIDNITSNLGTTTWDEVGGPGSIKEFTNSGSLVVSLWRCGNRDNQAVRAPKSAMNAADYWLLVRDPTGKAVRMLRRALVPGSRPDDGGSLDERKAELLRPGDAVGCVLLAPHAS